MDFQTQDILQKLEDAIKKYDDSLKFKRTGHGRIYRFENEISYNIGSLALVAYEAIKEYIKK